MTDVRCLIKYSPDIIEVTNNLRRRIDIWRKATDGIGRFEVGLLGDWSGEFLADDPIQIRFNDIIVFEGYIDKGTPIAEGKSYDQFYKIVGRDYGQDLMNKQVNKTGDWMYKVQYADLIIDDMLSKTSSEITFTPSGDHKYGTEDVIPQISYTDAGDEYLLESFRKIFEEIDYDFYVDENKALQIFPIGSVDSGILLTNYPESANNNLLNLKKIEFDAYDLKNYVIAKVRKNDDGWTDGNAADFVKEAYNTITNDFVEKRKGISSIKCVKGEGDNIKLGLEFPKYSYDHLPFDIVQEETVRFNIRYAASQSDNLLIQLILEDNEGNKIVYMQKDFEKDLWHQMTVPMGKGVQIIPYLDTFGIWHRAGVHQWQYQNGYSSFTWKVVKITWLVEKNFSYHNTMYSSYVTTFWLDNLTLPFPMVSYKQDGTSQGLYKARRHVFMPNNIRTQSELDEFAQSELDKLKNPINSLRVVAVGSAGIIEGAFKWLPGYMVTVHSPSDGIDNEEYRIAEAHCIVFEGERQGHDFIVEAELVPKELSISGKRLSNIKDPDIALFRELSERIRYFEKAEEIYYDYLPPMPADAASKIKVGDFGNLADTAVAWTRHYEAEDSEADEEWAIVDDAMASKGKALKMAGAGTLSNVNFVNGPLGIIGELYFLVRLKVSDKTKSATISVVIIDKDEPTELASMTLGPAHFPANNKYHHFALRCEVPADKQNIRFFVYVTKSDDFDIYCDFGGIAPADIPLGYADVTISEHLGTDVSTHAGTDADPHAGTDTDAHAGTDTDAHVGSTAEDGWMSKALICTPSWSEETVSTGPGWTTLCTVPNCNPTSKGINLGEFEIHVERFTNDAKMQLQIMIAGMYYFDFYMWPSAEIPTYLIETVVPLIIPTDCTIVVRARCEGAGRHVEISGYVHIRQYKKHSHTMVNPDNHSVTQPSNHSVTQPGDHVVTNPEDHSITQPEDHTAEAEFHEH